LLAQIRAERGGGHDIDAPSECVGQLVAARAEIEETPPGIEPHENVDVARRLLLAAHHGSEDTYFSGAMACGDRNQPFAAPAEIVQ